MVNLSFKAFLEEVEETPNVFGALQSNLGIDPKAIKGTNWMSFGSLGKITFNGLHYKITRYVYDDEKNLTGAMVKPLEIPGVNTTTAFVKRDDKQIKVPNASIDTTERFIPIKTLNKIATQGMDSQASGGAGGLPI